MTTFFHTALFRGRTLAALCGLMGCAGGLIAQQPIGSVGVADATVQGALEVSNGRAMLLGASTVTAKDHTAEVTLNRGGSVRVCSTSGLHLTAGKGAAEAPLMLALDRGAIEVAAQATTSDVVMTPDLRFTMKSAGPLDLRMRVARNGDTCVENRGTAAPVLGVSDPFGEASYEVKPGQHVLFEHGSLKEVVDHESEPCGCPAVPVVSVADAGVTGGTTATPGSEVAAKAAATQHPFPAAQSAGLAPVNGPPQAPAGEVHAQVSTSMSYGSEGGSAGAGEPAPGAATAGTSAMSGSTSKSADTSIAKEAPASANQSSEAATNEASANESAGKAEAPPPPPAPSAGNVFHSIGHFFKRLFGGH
jgi:hypothetical protein